MKTFYFSIFLLVSNFIAWANPPELSDPKPEKIYSFVRVLYPVDYYVEQAQLWKKETESNHKNGEAWLNYYQAARISNIFRSPDKPFDLDLVFDNLQSNIPNSYEYHYISFVRGGGNPDLFHHLEKAYEIAPNRPEIYQAMVAQYELRREIGSMKKFCQKLYDNKEFSAGMLAWNYNMLMSLEQNAVLITYGDNDTYPAWLLQNAKQVRTDIKILNIHLLGKEIYRTAIFEENSIPEFTKTVDDFPAYKDFLLEICTHILTHSSKPTYLGIATSKEMRDYHSANLYLVGLALKYSLIPMDNVRLLKENFETQFLTDHLQVNLENDFSASVLRQLNQNYLPAFMTLHKHYTENDAIQKAGEIEQYCLRIAETSNRLEQIKFYLQKQTATHRTIESAINLKDLDKSLQPIQEKLYAVKTEVNNGHYEAFLMDLLKNREFDLLETCKTTKTDWRALLPHKFQNLDDETIYVHGHPDDPISPIQNISYEAAQLYCAWLTNAYNNTDFKKKRFSKVTFRLPTEEEWEFAAHAKRESSPYPWGGYYYKNMKGCFLSNFYSSDEPPCIDCNNKHPANDGSFFGVNVTSYFPNDFGLYGLSGNVAEMVKEKGLAKGGSWEDHPDNCTITSKKEYDQKSPAIGFRVFMEIVD